MNAKGLSTEMSTEPLSTERLSTETHSQWLSTEKPSSEPSSHERFASYGTEAGSGSVLGGLSEQTRRLLAQVPATRPGRSEWLKQLARNEEIALHLVRHLGGSVGALDSPFRCLLHPDCEVTLTRGGNGEILYSDPSLASSKRQFQTIPEIAAAVRSRSPRRLRGLQLAVSSLRLLHEAGLIELPRVSVPQVAHESAGRVHRARNGYELLLRCRWFLDPEEPVSYTRSFVEAWCDIPKAESRAAIFALIQQGVIVRVGEAAPRNGRRAASLYLPGTGAPA
jgi:hypothetical protein